MDKAAWKKQKELIKKMKQNNPNWPKIKPKPHGSNQMSLGSLIKALQKERSGLPVHINNSINVGHWSEGHPGMPHSYYGYPSDLAFTLVQTPITVKQFLTVCESAIRASFTGPDHSEGYYRDYIMKANTPIWISELDKASNNGVVDVISSNELIDHVSIIIKPIEDEEVVEDDSKEE